MHSVGSIKWDYKYSFESILIHFISLSLTQCYSIEEMIVFCIDYKTTIKFCFSIKMNNFFFFLSLFYFISCSDVPFNVTQPITRIHQGKKKKIIHNFVNGTMRVLRGHFFFRVQSFTSPQELLNSWERIKKML